MGGLLVLMPSWVLAQSDAAAPSLLLKSSPRLQEKTTELERTQGAVFIEGDRITEQQDSDLLVQGHAQYRRPGLSLKADQLLYNQNEDRLQAQGNVRVMQDGNLYTGPSLQLRVDRFQGQFDRPEFELRKASANGTAERLEFIDADRAVAHQARFSSCRRTPGPEWLPEWLLKATRMEFDNAESVGTATEAQLVFLGVPLPSLPSLSFALNNERKSGLLAPTFGIDNVSGFELQTPYYWNIAPNRDATFTPVMRSKRGLGMDTEFRYLEPTYSGQARLNVLPNDPLRDQTRWGLQAQHQGRIETGSTGIGPISLNLSLARVSDDNYWRDFPRSGLVLTQRLLPTFGIASWSQGNLSLSAQVKRWQTLQLTESPITPPYGMAPQLVMRYGQWDAQGLDWSVVADTTRFEADLSHFPATLTAPVLQNGQRSFVQSQVSRSWIKPWGFVTPKLQLHATRYELDASQSSATSMDRMLPTFSLNSGLIFERPLRWLGRAVTQTLEPRAFYTYTPYRMQSHLPVYDSGPTDLNLSTIYSEQPYVGQDRLVDNNAMTLGVNTRFYDAQSGAELLSLGVAQRYRFSDQQVILPGQTASTAGLSDLLVGAGLRWDNRWSFDGTVQLNAQNQQIQRTAMRARYSPGPYRVLNTAYRQSNLPGNPTEQVDLGWQWPLSDLSWGARPDDSKVKVGGQGLGENRWYSVGRLNYSMTDKRLVDTLFGFEYDAGCWIGRVVFERLSSTVTSANTRLLFQLELVGFARVGTSPFKTLRDNIPRYQLLRDDANLESRFSQYE